MTLFEALQQFEQSLLVMGSSWMYFAEVFLGLRPWMESNVVAVGLSVLCYYWILRGVFNFFCWGVLSSVEGLGQISTDLWAIKDYGWNEPFQSLCSLGRTILSTCCRLAVFIFYLLLILGVGYLVIAWLNKVFS